MVERCATGNKCRLFFFIKLNVLKASSTKSVDPEPSELDPYCFPLYLHRLMNESSTQPAQITCSVAFFAGALRVK